MNVHEALNNGGVKGVTLGPVIIRSYFPREQKENKFKPGTMEWNQGLTVSDSTGEIKVYLTEKPDVAPLKGQVVMITALNLKAGKNGVYAGSSMHTEVKPEGSITHAPSAPDKNDDPLLLDNVPFQTKAAQLADTWEILRLAFEEKSGLKIQDVSALGAGTPDAYAQALATQNQSLIACVNSLFIAATRR